ncbi:MAG: hypothetical protein LBN95_01635 [Prevotellaceae bacterium]|jgi:hypothetical protein|nr:hypothetical protein [Prevotellaceae bacterium]
MKKQAKIGQSLSGLNEDKHQVIIRDIMFFCKDNNIDVLSEKRARYTCRGKIKTIVPDVVVSNIVFIEITKHRGYKKDIEKLKLAIKYHRKMQEGFIYDYDNNDWVKISIQNNEILEENSSYSDIFNIDFSDAV